MDKLEKVIKGITLCNTDGLADEMCPNCPYVNEANPICVRSLFNDALELLKEQQAEIERLKAEKNRVIEQIESEIHMLFKERGCVKDDVGIAQYQWLINGYQSALDMIKDGEQE